MVFCLKLSDSIGVSDYSVDKRMGISRKEATKRPLFCPGIQRGDRFNTRIASSVNSGQLLVSCIALTREILPDASTTNFKITDQLMCSSLHLTGY